MLKSINIRNIALIESLSLEFGKGLNVLSGETGAGKSILIDAVNLVLGERADRELIRRGCDRASVEAFFVCDDIRLKETLDSIGIIPEDEIVLSRELTQSGRNIARINGTLVNNAALKSVSALLIDIHGQHEHQSIFDPKAHIGLLDAYCGDSLLPIQKEYSSAFLRLREITKELNALGGDPGERERKKDMLRFAVDEITRENIQKDEEEQLEHDHRLMANAERISLALEEAYLALYGDENTSGGLELLETAAKAISSIASYGDEYAKASEELTNLVYQAESSIENVRELKYSFEYDPASLESIERRLADLQRLKRKYGGSIESVLAYLAQCEEELYQLEHSEELIARLIEEKDAQISIAYRAGKEMSALRQRSSKVFEAEIKAQLTDLGMGSGSFVVHFEDIPDINAYRSGEVSLPSGGLDQIEFLFSANRGEPPRPLHRIASGGEASRIMLALKNIFARIDGIDCLIFDEIDTGISGRMAHTVAEKMACISKERQVLCVSHLAQLAAMADLNYLIEKQELDDRTITHVHVLNPEERLREISRLAGGIDGDMISISHAKELVQNADYFKNTL